MIDKTRKIFIVAFLCSIMLFFSIIYCPFTNFNSGYAEADKKYTTNSQLKSDIEYKIGERKYFKEKYINNDDFEYILVALGEHCVIWVQYELWVDEITQNDYDLIQENVDKIYVKMSAGIYNHANSWGDVDNDGRINILLSDFTGSGINGYYEAANLIMGTESNYLDILFIDLAPELGLLNLRSNGGKALWADIAHEFQHMLFDIACTQNNATAIGRELWLNESLSAACAYLFSNDEHYIDANYFQYFLLDYSTENGFLFKRFGLTDGKEYLMTTLFGIYMYKQYGDNLLKELYENITSEISAEQLLLKVFDDKFADFEDLFSSFIAATVFDGIWSQKYSIYSEDITYDGKTYAGLFDLRSKNNLLYKLNLNIGERDYTNCKWQERVFYYDKTYFADMNRLNFETTADYMFYYLSAAETCSVFDSEIKIDNDEVVTVFVNCETESLSVKTIMRRDLAGTKGIIMIVSALVALLSVETIVIVIIVNKHKRDKENED